MSDALPRQIVETLQAGKPVDVRLPQGGRLHIDRPLPFLCLYRRPPGRSRPATEALVTTQAAWLVAPAGADLQPLLDPLLQYLHELFGACLLLELWSGREGPDELPPHAFRLVAPAQGAPTRWLEAMENALLQVSIHRKPPRISVVYQPQVTAPGLPPLLPAEQLSSHPCTVLGLEVNPVYRDPHTGETFTFAHRAFRQRLSRALKRGFYAFSHHYTTHRPAHFQVLGPRTLTSAVCKVDGELARISEGFDLLLHVTPVNGEQAWQQFRQHRFAREVEFLYRPRTIDPDLMKRRLYAIPLEHIDDPTLADIFAAKRHELDRQITLVADRNTPRFLLGSRLLFGDVTPECLSLARDILAHEAEPVGDEAEMLDAHAFATLAEAELQHYRRQDATFAARVSVRDDIAGIMVSHGNFLIGCDARVAKHRVGAALAHEIGTHALTYHNGRQQPLQELYCGMAGYEPLQEGLAVLAEYLCGQLGADRLRQLAGRVVAVQSISDGAGFIDTFRELHQHYGFDARAAFMMTMRTFRGGGYTKDAIYLQGLVALLEYLGQGHDLELLYLGKIAQAQLPFVEELRWRQVLKPPALLPRLLSQPDSGTRRARLAQGLTVMDMLREAV